MAIPHRSLLLAAQRWLTLLPENSPERCHAILTNSAKYADLAPSQYFAARQWLTQNGLFSGETAQLSRLKVFEAAVLESVWFTDADQTITTPAELPLDALEAAAACGLTEDEAFAAIRHRHSMVDTALRNAIGDAGELRFIELVRSCTACRVEHVARLSDGFGYDISIRGKKVLHAEVKSTTRVNQSTFYLSRNEFNTMLRDPHWRLVFLRLDQELRITEVSIVDTKWLISVAPNDAVPEVAWQSMRVAVPSRRMQRGICDLRDDLVCSESEACARLLIGSASFIFDLIDD
ncbi:hypothetical protein GORHZ_188_00090 [Gordonia rhizosphera NBRC 16068]|uniref:Protein NO VEIN C-terminal domain-containing protein n=2 Tax=Gordonia rhizosphera TaxID=83341 RepID=K6WKP0_9ACTN|nr:hypothetical protein GORHZ_188_00090 [Gordonia rhizosphera NBRC 16068]